MASYDYPKTQDITRVNFNSPAQEYKVSTFPTKPPPNIQNEKESKLAENKQVFSNTKRKMFSCFSFKYKKYLCTKEI